MLKAERQRYLIDRLAKDGQINSAELAKTLTLSEDSIRRDLRELAARGKLQKVHGGAIRKPPVPAAYAARLDIQQTAKVEIAKAAARLVQDGQTVFMDGGTTALAVAEQLSNGLQATIVTNAPPIASALIDHPGVEVFLAGGRINKQLAVTTGAETVDFLRQFRADLSLIGVCAVHPEIGLTLPTPDERATKRVMVEQSAKVVALAGDEKMDTSFSCVLAPIDRLNCLITDGRMTESQRVAYEAADVTIIQVCDQLGTTR